MNLTKTLENATSSINEVNEWAEGEYNKYFAQYFKGEVDLFNKMKDFKTHITDEELEWILTSLPLELFSVSEQLGKLKLAQEVIKLSIKQKERDYIASAEGSETKKKEEAQAITAEDRLLVNVYDTIYDRVSKQMTFSKELIMSAKKIWDARRNDGIPVRDIDVDAKKLPEYIK